MKIVRERTANFLRILRAMSCMTQEQMAKRLDISPSTYNAIEQGNQDFKVSFLDKLQTLANTDVTTILAIKENLISTDT